MVFVRILSENQNNMQETPSFIRRERLLREEAISLISKVQVSPDYEDEHTKAIGCPGKRFVPIVFNLNGYWYAGIVFSGEGNYLVHDFPGLKPELSRGMRFNPSDLYGHHLLMVADVVASIPGLVPASTGPDIEVDNSGGWSYYP